MFLDFQAIKRLASLRDVVAWLAFLSPMCFALMGPGHYLFGVQTEKRRSAFAQRLEPAVLLQPRNVE